MVKMNIKGVFQIWMRNGDYHEINLKECHAWTRDGCNHCPDFAAEHADDLAGLVDQVGDFVDAQTKGRYTRKIDQVQALAKSQLRRLK